VALVGKEVNWEYVSPIGVIVLGIGLDFFTLSGTLEMSDAYFLFVILGLGLVGVLLFGIDSHMDNRSLRLNGSKVSGMLGKKEAYQHKPEGTIIYAGRGCA
jgi:hypothetical protein